MIPTDHETEVIQTGLHFMRSITQAYGSEEGLKLWTTIADTIDPNIKSKIFFAMITGEYNNRIVIRGLEPYTDKVSLIKAIRTYDTRRYGLKEAKELADELYAGRKTTLEIEPPHRSLVVRELRNLGCLI